MSKSTIGAIRTKATKELRADAASIVHDAYAAHPEDVICALKTTADVLGWMEDLLKTIAQEATKKSLDRMRIRSLAEMGAYVAMDVGSVADRQHEEMFQSLQSKGYIAAHVVRCPELSELMS